MWQLLLFNHCHIRFNKFPVGLGESCFNKVLLEWVGCIFLSNSWLPLMMQCVMCCLSIWIQLRYILGIHLNSNLQNILIKLDNTLCHRKKWVLHYWNVNLSLQFCGFSNHVHVCHFRSKSLHLNINLNLWLPLNLGANR